MFRGEPLINFVYYRICAHFHTLDRVDLTGMTEICFFSKNKFSCTFNSMCVYARVSVCVRCEHMHSRLANTEHLHTFTTNIQLLRTEIRHCIFEQNSRTQMQTLCEYYFVFFFFFLLFLLLVWRQISLYTFYCNLLFTYLIPYVLWYWDLTTITTKLHFGVIAGHWNL